MSSRQTATAQQKEHCQGLPRGRGLLAWAVKDQADKLFQVSSRSSPRLVSGTLKDAQSALSLRCPSTQSPATPARALSAPKPQAKHQCPQSHATFFSLSKFIHLPLPHFTCQSAPHSAIKKLLMVAVGKTESENIPKRFALRLPYKASFMWVSSLSHTDETPNPRKPNASLCRVISPAFNPGTLSHYFLKIHSL